MPLSHFHIESIFDNDFRIRLGAADFTGVEKFTQFQDDIISEYSDISKLNLSDFSSRVLFEAASSWNARFKEVAVLNREQEADIKDNTSSESTRNISTDSTDSIDINQINEDFYKFLDKHSSVFVWTLKHTDFEDGIENAPIIEVMNYIRINRFVTFSWLHSIYSNNQKDSDVIAALLRIIGMTVENEDFDKLLPLVKAGLSDKSTKAQEAAIMVIEQWRSKNCLDAIQTAQFQSQWIREYAKQIELELKMELESC